MATEQLVADNTVSLPANGDLSANQFKAVDINSSGNVVLASSAGQRVIGVQQNKPSAAGQGTAVAVAGITKMLSSGTIAAGALVTTTNAGLAVTAASGNFILGRAVTGASANDVFEVLLMPGSAAVP